METSNQTLPTYFILKGISDLPELQTPIFLLVLLIYLITLVGNMTILLLICLDHQLQTPMYFFLGNLSILDMSSSTITLHNTLVMYVTGNNTISYINCFLQMYVFGGFTCDELLFLTAMSYDRYVAICKPLHYHLIMNRRLCLVLATGSWVLGLLEIIPFVVLLSGYTCYRSNIINHFFCDLVPVMKLSCNDTSLLESLFIIEVAFLLTFIPFLLIFICYVLIIISILKIRTSSGKRKAFYTCSSHLTVVILLYTTFICQYQRPVTVDSLESNKLFSLFNTAAVPILNPFIYSFNNRDVKSALRRRLKYF
ncbi:olfactory receptor 2AP1-like [Rhinophrynus dorsalis]